MGGDPLWRKIDRLAFSVVRPLDTLRAVNPAERGIEPLETERGHKSCRNIQKLKPGAELYFQRGKIFANLTKGGVYHVQNRFFSQF